MTGGVENLREFIGKPNRARSTGRYVLTGVQENI
jgi:hypothetical protein